MKQPTRGPYAQRSRSAAGSFGAALSRFSMSQRASSSLSSSDWTLDSCGRKRGVEARPSRPHADILKSLICGPKVRFCERRRGATSSAYSTRTDRQLHGHVRQRASDHALRAFATASGFWAATRSRACAGPSGTRRFCFQSRSLATLTPIIIANSVCDFPGLSRMALTSAGWKVTAPLGRTFLRRICPACRTLLARSSKFVFFT